MKPQQFKQQVDIEVGDLNVEFTRTTTYSHDAHYGADADGRRGIPMDFIDDDAPSNIRVTDAEGVTVPFAVLDSDTQIAVKAAVEHYLNTHDPEPEDERERGDDDGVEYDDPRDYRGDSL